MIPGLNVEAPLAPKHFNFPETMSTVDAKEWKFTYSSNDLKIVQFTTVPQFTIEEDDQIKKMKREHGDNWELIGKVLDKSPVSCRFRYYGPLQGK